LVLTLFEKIGGGFNRSVQQFCFNGAFKRDAMPETGRPGLSVQQKKELWNRWENGQSLSKIGRALSKHAGSIHGVLSVNEGNFST
jgi:hypothetical protein